MSTTQSDFLRYLRTLTARQATGFLSDQQLLERFLHERSETSFAALVARHGPMVLSVCRRILHHAQDAEDAFQATFLVLARKAGSIRKQSSLGSWLHGVADHSAECLKAKARRRTAHEHRLNAPPPGDAMGEITWRELRSVLDEELQRLPEKYRAPLVLCYLEGRTQDEAARQFGWSKSTLRRRLEQGRDVLGRRLTSRGISLTAALTASLLADAAAQAAVPPLLAANTVRAGLAAAMGNTVNGIVSAQVVALVEGGVASLLSKKACIPVILLVPLMLGVGGLLAHRADRSGSHAEAPVAPQSLPVHRAGKGESVEIKGRVLGPDGKPFAGAKIYLWSKAVQTKEQMQVRATTDADGRFRFSIGKADRHRQAKIVAAATDHGLDWVEWTDLKSGEAATLRLVKDDVPIQGRILDLEGKPVANATVRVLELFQTDLDKLIRLLERHRYFSHPKTIEMEEVNAAAQTRTGADGRFQLHSFGRERLIHLEISGETIERVRCFVMTRAARASDLKNGDPSYYPASFHHFAAPTKPIVGTVREKGTGKPLAGITVRYGINETKTDASGKYRLIGIAKQRDYAIAAAGPPYFASAKRGIADTPGLNAIPVDFELERGIEIRGRVLNKATGEPIKAEVTYHALSGNPHLKRVAGLDQGTIADDRNTTKADGSFFVVGLPGPGYLVVLADEDDYHKVEKPDDGEKVVPYVNFAPPLVHAWVRVDPSESNPESTRYEIALEPAKPIPGEVHGPDGKPLGGYFVAGLTGSPVHHTYETLRREEPAFRVRGFDANRPRTLIFFHPEKRLGKVQTLHEAPLSPLKVRLAPFSILTGRVLDARGRPWTGLRVHARLSMKPEDTIYLPSLLPDWEWRKRLEVQGSTDASGKFHLDGLMPGLKYILEVRERDRDGPVVFRLNSWAAAESGKTKDLGNLKSKVASARQAEPRP